MLVTQNLASLTTPASCGVQKKVVCGSSWVSHRMVQEFLTWSDSMFRHTFRISVSVQHILVVPSSNQRLRSAKVKALLLQRCALRKFHVTDGHNTRDQITSDRKSKRAWSKCVLYIQYIFSGRLNEYWLHTCDACVIATWKWAQGVPRDLEGFILDTPKVPFKITSIHSLHKLNS